MVDGLRREQMEELSPEVSSRAALDALDAPRPPRSGARRSIRAIDARGLVRSGARRPLQFDASDPTPRKPYDAAIKFIDGARAGILVVSPRADPSAAPTGASCSPARRSGAAQASLRRLSADTRSCAAWLPAFGARHAADRLPRTDGDHDRRSAVKCAGVRRARRARARRRDGVVVVPRAIEARRSAMPTTARGARDRSR